jgi:hypothetical protein
MNKAKQTKKKNFSFLPKIFSVCVCNIIFIFAIEHILLMLTHSHAHGEIYLFFMIVFSRSNEKEKKILSAHTAHSTAAATYTVVVRN